MNAPTRRRWLAFAASALCAPAGWAQGKVTRLVVAFPPGGPVDLVARTLADALGKALGQQVIVENKAGANGSIAAEYVAHAAPDGQTIWLTSVGAVSVNPALYEKLPYDPQRDLVPVSLVVRNVEVLVVPANAPYSDGAAFIAAARKSVQPFTLASSGTGSMPHLSMELLADASKAPLLHVPYKGAAPAINDVIAGHVQGFIGDIPALLGFIKGGKLKAIGIAAPKRHALLPEVKTFDEMGLPGVHSDNWYGLVAPKGTPAAEVDRLNRALRKALDVEAVHSRLVASGTEPAPSTPAELAALIRSDLARWSAVVKAKKIKPD